MGEAKNKISNSRCCQSDQQRRTATDSIGEFSPQRRAQQLGNRIRGNDETRDGSHADVKMQHRQTGTAQLLHIKRQQRNDHQQSDHVDERRDHQREELCRDLPDFFVENVEQRDRDRAE